MTSSCAAKTIPPHQDEHVPATDGCVDIKRPTSHERFVSIDRDR
jgi:hypothetical protein